MNKLYPLKFNPIYLEKIWGGSKLKDHLNKNVGDLKKVGESWELSGVVGNESVVSNGFLKGNTINELVEIYLGDLVGDKVFSKFGEQFPLLIKFIDATQDLSIQVHPSDDIAMERHDSYGKTEMWYIIQADPESKLISGFKADVSVGSYLEHLNNKSLNQILGYHEVSSGDVFFMPSGRVHAIGAGIMLAEIQQTSDITYRIYDFDRRDNEGNLRELHTDEALDVIDYSEARNAKIEYKSKSNVPVEVVKCEYFTTNVLDINQIVERDYFKLDSFVIYICLEGSVNIEHNAIETVNIKKGETVLIPAELKLLKLNPESHSKILEVYI